MPRHPERFVEVAQLSVDDGFTTHKLSSAEAPGPDAQVIVGDTMGDLMGLFGVADIAFVGGSLIERGGHNLLEPALWALPVLSGLTLFAQAVLVEGPSVADLRLTRATRIALRP